MAAEAITQLLNRTLIPLSFVGFLLALLALWSTISIPGLSMLSTIARLFFTSSIMQLLIRIFRPFQLIAIIHVFRNRTTRRDLNVPSKWSLFGFGMQAFPMAPLLALGEALAGGGGKDVDALWSMVGERWKECLELGLVIIVFGLEFGCKNGMPYIGRQIDAVIDKVEGQDALEKGMTEEMKVGS